VFVYYALSGLKSDFFKLFMMRLPCLSEPVTDHERKDIYISQISGYKAKIKDGFKKLYGVSG